LLDIQISITREKSAQHHALAVIPRDVDVEVVGVVRREHLSIRVGHDGGVIDGVVG
jgi:hypothetical protein